MLIAAVATFSEYESHVRFPSITSNITGVVLLRNMAAGAPIITVANAGRSGILRSSATTLVAASSLGDVKVGHESTRSNLTVGGIISIVFGVFLVIVLAASIFWWATLKPSARNWID